MFTATRAFIISTAVSVAVQTQSFSTPTLTSSLSRTKLSVLKINTESVSETNIDASIDLTSNVETSRRSVLQHSFVTASAVLSAVLSVSKSAEAAVGTLKEFSDTNAIFQSVTIDVTDKKQFEDTIAFFLNGFDGCKVLRERGGNGGGVVKDAVRIFVRITIPCTISYVSY